MQARRVLVKSSLILALAIFLLIAFFGVYTAASQPPVLLEGGTTFVEGILYVQEDFGLRLAGTLGWIAAGILILAVLFAVFFGNRPVKRKSYVKRSTASFKRRRNVWGKKRWSSRSVLYRSYPAYSRYAASRRVERRY